MDSKKVNEIISKGIGLYVLIGTQSKCHQRGIIQQPKETSGETHSKHQEEPEDTHRRGGGWTVEGRGHEETTRAQTPQSTKQKLKGKAWTLYGPELDNLNISYNDCIAWSSLEHKAIETLVVSDLHLHLGPISSYLAAMFSCDMRVSLQSYYILLGRIC